MKRSHKSVLGVAVALALAVVVFLLSGIPLYQLMRHVASLSLDVAEWSHDNGYPRFCTLAAIRFGEGLVAVPSFLAGLCVFVWCSRRIRRDAFTRCGKCGYILDGLGKLRCPECGKEV